jgi:hypothetical protein
MGRPAGGLETLAVEAPSQVGAGELWRGLWRSSGKALACRGRGEDEDEDESVAAGEEGEDQAGECEDQVDREVEDDCCTLN